MSNISILPCKQNGGGTSRKWLFKLFEGLCERTEYVPQVWNWENHF